ncbi:MAG: hypothetical protein A2Y23_10100 [Clostridiales bacterium GWB2_37_7]|nr:MAG: hypothetical protein A2Y23_10100 [Clostridiales bacterium GWB2_37_7]
MLFTLVGVAWIILTYKIGDWRNWKLYYPTILFFWCGDLIYNVVFYEKPLWVFENPIFTHHLTDLISIFIVFTCTVLIYIPHYPKTFKKQLLYLGFWVLLYSSIEWIFHVLGGISYRNGWDIGLSVVHNTYQFALLRIHHDRPILAWILALIILSIVMAVFDVDLIKAF